jgi:hypothetical protein
VCFKELFGVPFFVGKYDGGEILHLGNTVVNGFADLLIGWSADSCWRIFSENIFLFEKDELNLYPKTHQHETRIQTNP